MDILVVGAGGREHAIIRKLRESPRAGKIYCACGNGGISADAECVPLKPMELDKIVDFAVEKNVGLVFVAPDDPLVAGLVDKLEARGIPAFGPRAAAAAIEGSKVFSKQLMKDYSIPTAAYEVFSEAAPAIEYIRARGEFPVVIKADGLALGKGVIIAQSMEEAEAGVRSIIEDKIFGASGNQIVVEEFLTGPEVSVLAFTDGETMCPMVSSMDHKRALDGDKGLNTGGMGTIAPNPFYTPEVAALCMETIFLPTMRAMNKEGRTFSGCLYFGLMLTPKGPYVIEYNCRFGDPETQVVLPLLKTDLLEIVLAVCEKRLGQMQVEWDNGAAACVVMASGGYPGKYETGLAISGLDESGQVEGATVYHAGTKREDGVYKTAGGRVLGVTATGGDLDEALSRAYKAVERISFPGEHHRTDIGKKR